MKPIEAASINPQEEWAKIEDTAFAMQRATADLAVEAQALSVFSPANGESFLKAWRLFSSIIGSDRQIEKFAFGLLQTYQMTPVQRKAIEAALRVFSKRSVRITYKKLGLEGARERYAKLLDYCTMFTTFFNVAKTLVASGAVHGEAQDEVGAAGAKTKAGSFLVTNVGGFSDKVMADVVAAVKKADQLLKASGFSSVCYGDVYVTKTLQQANVLAFYVIASDDLFVRANARGNDLVQTILHEFGHRYYYKSLSNRNGIYDLYKKISGQEDKREFPVPSIGDTATYKGVVWTVTKANLRGVSVVNPDGRTGFNTLRDWYANKGTLRDFLSDAKYLGFVSAYARKGGPEENFAEMFSYYCMGDLPVLQSVPFEELVFGKSEQAAKVAYRYLTR